MRLNNIFFLVILFMGFMVMSLGSIQRLSDEEEGLPLNTTDIEGKLVWELNYTDSCLNNSVNGVGEWACKTADYVGYSGMFFARESYKFGYNNPEYDFEFLSKIVLAIGYCMIISYLFFPVATIIFLVYLLVKYIIEKVKEK